MKDYFTGELVPDLISRGFDYFLSSIDGWVENSIDSDKEAVVAWQKQVATAQNDPPAGPVRQVALAPLAKGRQLPAGCLLPSLRGCAALGRALVAMVAAQASQAALNRLMITTEDRLAGARAAGDNYAIALQAAALQVYASALVSAAQAGNAATARFVRLLAAHRIRGGFLSGLAHPAAVPALSPRITTAQLAILLDGLRGRLGAKLARTLQAHVLNVYRTGTEAGLKRFATAAAGSKSLAAAFLHTAAVQALS